jgi:glucose-6-phosphate 1-epimerase
MVANHFDKIVHSSLGAQILSAKFVNDKNIFYKSPINEFGKTYRGGMPILFPQFANKGHLKKHGFVRDIEWELIHEQQDEGQTIIEYDCNIDVEDCPDWPYNAKLTMFCEIGHKLCAIKLIVINTDNKSFSFTGGLHPYFAISSRDKIEINGLEGATCVDSFPDIPFSLDGNALIERLYESNQPVNLFTGENWLNIQCKGFENWMIWNPGEAEGLKINDLPNDHWDKFICIEPLITNPKTLKPGEIFISELNILLI